MSDDKKIEMIEVMPNCEIQEDLTDATISNIEIAEIKDSIMPLETNFDNKAFELEDIHIDKNYFNRQERPGTMMSMTSMTSKTSRSSINCANGSVRCPNLRLKRFFSYDKQV